MAETGFARRSVRTISFGSAAGCEARLCRAVGNLRDDGLCPRFGLWPKALGHSPNRA